jgi:hypothetical protein
MIYFNIFIIKTANKLFIYHLYLFCLSDNNKMDSGHVAELDTPENLQNNPHSAFNGLLHSLTD